MLLASIGNTLEANSKMHLTPKGDVIQDNWIYTSIILSQNQGVYKTDSKCSNIAARCRSHTLFC
jgi:hypothetical protein